ncbi:TPA: TipC family immunity protein [Streptococcus suis]|uniref:TipC family immunity protein n=1 Tax=Streptococcus suis TaxID=1307 RepID=UPI00195FBF76|nr:TipC family immunity protein [Streptococcus suis]MBM7137261.1 TipC family immunity protein [Streptococcus suis]MBO3641487.1 TipC family immunity protein [Streptococcus suis]MBY4600371.1 TipC family immunity protein [Streptococcus suis]MCO8171858.1 TipC family immunity protein [Streptococcus suis]MCO8180582.1 TipC family immunity protein [Streptococcus suis]
MNHKFSKYFFIIVIIVTSSFLIFKVFNYYSQNVKYNSLENVFLEMNYAEVYSGALKGLPDLSTVLGSPQSFREPDRITELPVLVNDPDGGEVSIFVGLEQAFSIEYSKKLGNDTYLYIDYEYRDKKLLGSIEISNSNSSLVWAKSDYWIDKKRGEAVNLQEHLESSYWFSSSKGLPSLQLTEKEEVLNYWRTYGIDATWLREKSSYILNDVVLKTWFEKGSQRYSFDNLGDVKIIESSVLK